MQPFDRQMLKKEKPVWYLLMLHSKSILKAPIGYILLFLMKNPNIGYILLFLMKNPNTDTAWHF